MEGLGEHSPAYDVIIARAAGEVRERGGRNSRQQLPVMGGNARLVVPCVLGTVDMCGNAMCGNARFVVPCVLSRVRYLYISERHRRGTDSLFSDIKSRSQGLNRILRGYIS